LNNKATFQDILDQAALKLFIMKMREFDEFFCAAMNKGSDFTLRLEVKGNSNELKHVRVLTDEREVPGSS